MASKVVLSLKEYTEGWTKWDVALYVGAPVALGLAGVWFYKRNKSQDGKGHKSNSASTDKSSGKTAADISSTEPETPIEKAQAAKAKGNKYFKGGKYDQAIKCYTEAINLCPPDKANDLSTFYQNRAASFEYLTNYDGVVQDCSKAIELNPKYTKAFGRRSKAFQQLGKLKESLEDITTACILEGFTNQVNLHLADQVLKDLGRKRAKESFGHRKPILPSTFFVKNYFIGFANDPINEFDAEDDQLPTSNTSASAEAAASKGSTGETASKGDAEREHTETTSTETTSTETTSTDEAAIKDTSENTATEKNLEENSKEETIHKDKTPNGLQNGLKIQSSFETAVENVRNGELEDIISLCTDEIEKASSQNLNLALLLRGTFYMMCGQADLGLADFETLISAADVDKKIKVNAIIKQSSLFIQKEKVAEAFTNFDKAIEIDPQNSDIYHHRGQQFLVVDNLEKALEDFDKSISLSPEFSTSYVQKAYTVHRTGVMYQKQSALTEAGKLFEAAIEKFPNYADAYLMYAQSLTDQGKYDEGIKNFDKALELSPDNANIYVHKGLLLVQWRGQFDEGSKLVEKAIEVDPKCEYAYEILGTIDVQRGKMPQALESFNKAISLSRTEGEMAHLHSLLNAAQAQVTVAHNLGIPLPSMS